MASPLSEVELLYQPDSTVYQARTKRRLKTEKLDQSLPEQYPAQLISPLSWEPRDFGVDKNSDEPWVYTLNAEQLDEIEHATRHFQCSSTLLNHPVFIWF